MTVIFDRRWDGPHGIGRFATEVRRRMHGNIVDLHGSHPVSLKGLIETEAELFSNQGRPDTMFFSPGYVPSLTWRGPSAVVVHDLIHLKIAGEAGLKTRSYYEVVLRPHLRRECGPVFTVSEYSKCEIVEWATIDPSRVIVVGNGVDNSFSPEGTKRSLGRPYLLHVGNTRPHKNTEAELRVLRSFEDHLLIFSGNFDARVFALADAMGVADRVLFLEGIPEPDLPAWYRGADCVLILSIYEGFGLPALEGLACGVPVLAADRAALPEVVGQAGVVVNPLDDDSVHKGLERALSSEEQARARWAGPKQAKLFTWDSVAASISSSLGGWL